MAKPGVEFIRKVEQAALKQKLPLNTEVHYQLKNKEGQVVMSKTVMNFQETAITEKLEVSHLPSGHYVLVISTGNPPELFDSIEINL